MNLSLVAPLNTYTGYGIHACQMARLLPSHGVNVSIRPTQTNEAFSAAIPESIKSKVLHGLSRDEWELIISPPTLAPTTGKKTAYFTMYEATRLPASSVQMLNKARMVIVPSQWNASTFSAAGVTAPIHVVPLGVPEEFTRYRAMPSGPFIFSCAGRLRNGPNRKGINRIIGLFKKTFGNNPNVLLRVKVFPDCPVASETDPRIRITRSFLSDSEMCNWLANAHCFINLATGGWELLAHESMALGRPVISPAFGGITEYFNDSVGFVVEHDLVEAGDVWTGQGLWAHVDDDCIMEAMRWAVEHRDECERVGFKAHTSARKLTWEHSCVKLVSAISSQAMVTEPPSVVLKRAKICVVQLGRYGDIINILPLLHQWALINRERIALMVAKDYLPVVEGLSYVDPVVWEGPFEEVREAQSKAEEMFPQVVVTQVYGKNYGIVKLMQSFNEESWRLSEPIWSGREEDFISGAPLFTMLPLVFDNRDFARERMLARQLLSSERPNVLLNLSGNSSPFPEAEKFKVALMEKLCPDVNVVDISNFTAERIYDLLGLMDRSSCLITIDTATMHLARASNIPVIAICNGHGWLSTKPTCNVALKIDGYKNAHASVQLISTTAACYSRLRRMLHAHSIFIPGGEGSARRSALARWSWKNQYRNAHWVDAGATNAAMSRNFKEGNRELPYIKDIIRSAMVRSDADDEVIVLTNGDTCLTSDATQKIQAAMIESPAMFCYRRDFERLDGLKSLGEVSAAEHYSGCDLFAFTVGWWKEHEKEYPDMLLAAEAWDWCMRVLVLHYGGCEVKDIIYHERHDGVWESNRFTLPSQAHNMKLAKEFLKLHGVYNGEFER